MEYDLERRLYKLLDETTGLIQDVRQALDQLLETAAEAKRSKYEQVILKTREEKTRW